MLVTSSIAAQLGYSDIFNANAKLGASMFLLDFVNLFPRLSNTITGNVISGEYWGFCVRVVITAYNLEANAGGSLGLLSGQFDANNTKSSYFVEVIGLPLTLQKGLPELFSANTGNFDETAATLCSAAATMIGDILSDPQLFRQVTPALLYVDLNLANIPTGNMNAFCYSMRQIANGNTLQQATGTIPTKLVSCGGQITYEDITNYYNLLKVNIKPVSIQQSDAKLLLFS